MQVKEKETTVKSANTIKQNDCLFSLPQQKADESKKISWSKTDIILTNHLIMCSRNLITLLFTEPSGCAIKEMNEYKKLNPLFFFLGVNLSVYDTTTIYECLQNKDVRSKCSVQLQSPALLNVKTYQTICTDLLRSHIEILRTTTEIKTEHILHLWIILRLTEFFRFTTHDESWLLCTELYLYLIKLSSEEKKNKNNQLIEALQQLVQHRRLYDLNKLSIPILKDAQNDSTLPLNFTTQTLLCEFRESAMHQHQNSVKEENDRKTMDRIKKSIYMVGTVIDVCDREQWRGNWCPAEILQVKIDPKTKTPILHIKWIGWDAKFNRTLNSNTDSEIMAPLCTHTKFSQLVDEPAKDEVKNTVAALEEGELDDLLRTSDDDDDEDE